MREGPASDLTGVSEFFDHVVRSLVHRRPEGRFQSAMALADALFKGESSDWWQRRNCPAAAAADARAAPTSTQPRTSFTKTGLLMFHADALRGRDRMIDALRVLDDAARAQPRDPAIRNAIGLWFRDAGDPKRARAELLAAIELAPPDPHGRELESMARSNLGLVYMDTGQLPEAREQLRLRLEYLDRHPDPRARAAVLNSLGSVYFREQRYAQAREHYQLAWRSARACGYERVAIVSLSNLGNVAYALGNYNDAERLYRTSRKLASRADDVGAVASARANEAGVLVALGRLADAQRLYATCLEVARGRSAIRDVVLAHLNLGAVFTLLAQDVAAEASLLDAVEMARDRGLGDLEPLARLGLGEYFASRGDDSKAMECFCRALLALGPERRAQLAQAHLGIGLVEARNDDAPDARRELSLARDLALEAGGTGVRGLFSGARASRLLAERIAEGAGVTAHRAPVLGVLRRPNSSPGGGRRLGPP